MKSYKERNYNITHETGNTFLDFILKHTQVDHTGDYGLCELLDCMRDPQRTLTELNRSEPNFNFEDKQLIEYMQEVCTLIEYKLGINGYYDKLPKWVFNKHFYSDEAKYMVKRTTPHSIALLFLTANNVFIQRNVYFDINSLTRY